MTKWYICVGSRGYWTYEGDLDTIIDVTTDLCLDYVRQRVIHSNRIYYIYITAALIRQKFYEENEDFLTENLNEEGIYELYPFLRQNLGLEKVVVLNYIFHVDKDRNMSVKLKIEYGDNKIEEREWVIKL